MAMYGYARVSTKGQEQYGNSLQAQVEQLIQSNVPRQNIYQDSFTGTKMDRPNFTKLLSILKPGDTLVITKLDRFARTAADGVKTIQKLLNNSISVNILNMGVADNTPMGKLMITIMLAFAEFERDMIVDRTQTGKAVKKAKDPNFRQGRPQLNTDTEQIKQLYADHVPADEAARILHISKRTYYNRLHTLCLSDN